jgi:hypothetical protein
MACVFLPLPPPLPLRNSDRCIRRPSYEAQSAFPRARTSSLCPRPCHVLSLESNGEFPLARTVGVDDRAGELVVRACLAAHSVCAVGAFLYGGCRAGRARSALGRAARASRRGRSPQEAVLWWLSTGAGVVHSGKFQFLLISVSWAIFCTVIKGLEGEIPRKRAVRA